MKIKVNSITWEADQEKCEELFGKEIEIEFPEDMIMKLIIAKIFSDTGMNVEDFGYSIKL
jgi:hypothetical protein